VLTLSPDVTKPRLRLIAVLAPVVVGAGIGIATSYAQADLSGAWAPLANASSPWLLGAFVAGAVQLTAVRATLAGLIACLLEVAAYYIVDWHRGFSVHQTDVVFWGLCAVIGGPLFGWGAWLWWRGPVARRGLGAALLPATFLGEAIGTYEIRLRYSADTAVLFATIGLVLFALVAWRTRPLWRTVVWTAAATVVAIVVYGPVLDASAGAAFGG
jgi:hypothetical protein